MSKKSKIFSYGTGKRKIGHSKFDVGFTNTYTQGFGALNPVALYETLPDDYWNVGSDGVTLLKPLAAPAFSDIKQHFYAFNVRNSAIWEHWNDFITNGTAFSDVYGSNASNQSADNPWKIPSINAGYLQDICKIGTGFAVEYHTISVNSSDTTLFTNFFKNFFFYNYLIDVSYDVTDAVSLYFGCVFYGGNYSFYSSDVVSFAQVVTDSFVRATLLGDTLTLVFASSQQLALHIANFITTAFDFSVVESSVSSSIGSNISDVASSVDVSVVTEGINYLAFCDDSSSICKRSLSPFVLSQGSYYYKGKLFKTFFWKKRVATGDSNVSFRQNNKYILLRSLDTNFLGRCYVVDLVVGNSSTDFIPYFQSSSVIDSSFDPSSTPYWTVDIGMLRSGSTMHGIFHNVLLFCQQVFDTVVPYFGVTNSFDVQVSSPFGVSDTSSNFLLNVFAPAYVSDTDIYVSQARSLGYDGSGFCVYLCRSAVQLLDSLNYPVAALACRSYLYYRYQDFNALPLFANSKIWDKFFRNTVVSSPELDYSKTNGQIFLDGNLRAFLQRSSDRPSQMPEKYVGVDISEMPFNGWCIPFESIPLNSMLSDGGITAVSSSDTVKYVAALSGHHNLLTIRSRQDVFALLTGFGLQEMVLSKMYKAFTDVTALNGVSYKTFSELFTKNFYLPSYYNGLCHLKFQNFNKDYFTAAMLDPMSGANEVEIGATVTENRVAEVKQSWFERIAQQRSVKGFMEAIFGITPTLDDKEPRFLGSHHVRVNIGEVIQTSSSTSDSPQGQRVGIGGARGDGSLVHGHVNEHGWIIIYNSFTVESQYHQGLEKQLLPVNSYMDYPTIDFASVGNESILMKELNFDGEPRKNYDILLPGSSISGPYSNFFAHFSVVDYGVGNPHRIVDSGDLSSFPVSTSLHLSSHRFKGLHNYANGSGTSLDNVFGYIPRYSSYKFKLDQVHGEFLDELEFWHTFRNLHGMPILSHEFVNWELCVDDNEFNRIFSVTTSDDGKFCCETRFNASVDRALPYVCVPHSK